MYNVTLSISRRTMDAKLHCRGYCTSYPYETTDKHEGFLHTSQFLTNFSFFLYPTMNGIARIIGYYWDDASFYS